LEDILKQHGIELPGAEYKIIPCPGINKSSGDVPQGLPDMLVQACVPGGGFGSLSSDDTFSSIDVWDSKSSVGQLEDEIKACTRNELHITQLLRTQQWATEETLDFAIHDPAASLISGRARHKRKQLSHAKRIEELLDDVTSTSYDYLMDRFWTCYNSTNPVLNRKHYEDVHGNKRGRRYSIFLELCMLSMGYHYAEEGRPRLHGFGPRSVGSVFHNEVKNLLPLRAEEANRLCSIVGFIILSDLEFALGNDNLAKSYCDTAVR
jgi:hypothetical protein